MLKPPDDFRPQLADHPEPSAQELQELWAAEVRRRREREREQLWRGLREDARRTAKQEITAVGETPPGFLEEVGGVGPRAVQALRPVPREGTVTGVGVDTWSLSWYADPDSAAARAMSSLATSASRMARLIPEKVGGHRVGWFPDFGLIFAEGHPSDRGLAPAAVLVAAEREAEKQLADAGIPIAEARRAGLRRVDVAADVVVPAGEGLRLLEAASAVTVNAGKVVAYRSGRATESVTFKTRAGSITARLYDKGVEAGTAPRGQHIRPEAQWRFPKAKRPSVDELTSDELRELFRRRIAPMWDAAEGIVSGSVDALARRIREAISTGQLEPSRARSLCGHLVLASVDAPVGSPRVRYQLDRDCRELGLALMPSRSEEAPVQLAQVIDECLQPERWR